jgi:hypothetical protein
MGTTDADTDEGLSEEKPFSPMYPVFNFGSTVSPQVDQNTQAANQLPPYQYDPPHLPPKLGF